MPLPLGLINYTNESIELRDMGIFMSPGSGTNLDLTGQFLVEEFQSSESLKEQVVVSGTVAISGSEGVLTSAEAVRFFSGAGLAEQNLTVDGFDLRTLSAGKPIVGNDFVTVTSGEDSIVIATNTDGLREEIVGPIAPSGITFQIGFTNQGTTNDQWLRVYGPIISSNEAPYIVPWDSQLTAITYINSLPGSEANVEVHKSAITEGASTTIVHNWAIRDVRVCADSTVSASGIEFDQGDKIAVFIDTLSNPTRPKDVTVTLYFRGRSGLAASAVEENYLGDFE